MDNNVKLGLAKSRRHSSLPSRVAQLIYKYLIAGLASLCVIAALSNEVASAQSKTAATGTSFTAAQAARGKESYESSCMDCHGANLDDGEFGGAPLKGSAFRAKWLGGSAGRLFAYTRAAMPPDRAGRLPAETYADIVAYLLSRNDVSAGTEELPADLAIN